MAREVLKPLLPLQLAVVTSEFHAERAGHLFRLACDEPGLEVRGVSGRWEGLGVGRGCDHILILVWRLLHVELVNPKKGASFFTMVTGCKGREGAGFGF